MLLGGLPGSGKSTLAASIARTSDVVVVRSDEVRKEMAGIAYETALPVEMYASSVSASTYKEVLERGDRAIREGHNVILDATWSRASSRVAARGLASEVGARMLEVHCVASVEVMAERLTGRKPIGAYASDADVKVMEAMGFEAWPEAVKIDSGSKMTIALAEALAVIREVEELEGNEKAL